MKRKPLSAVLGAARAKPAKRDPGRRARGERQVNLLMAPDLWRDAKIKALREGSDLSTVVGDLLAGWLAE